jgi:hypothetical protein
VTDVDDLSFDAWDALSIVEWFQADPGAPVPASCKLLDFKYAHENPGAWAEIDQNDLPSGINPETARVLLETEALVEQTRSQWTESRHPGHSNQKVHGRKGKGKASLSDEDAGKLAGELKTPDGGFTFNPRSGKPVTSGFAVAMHKDRSEEIDLADATPARLKSYVDKNKDLLDQDDNMFGGWHDPASGKVWLDISAVKSDKDEAIKLGKKHNQIAIFDLENFTSVDTGGTGRSTLERFEQRADATKLLEKRFSVVTREVDRVGDNCPECQRNTDPSKVPVHPGCNCDAITTEVETGLRQEDLPDLQQIVADANTAAALPLSDMRYGDLLRWAEQVGNDLDDLSAITAVVSEEEDTFYALLSTVVEGEFSFEEGSAFALDAIGGKVVGRLQPGSAAGLREMFDKLMEGRH